MTISERVERIRTELAETRATFNPQWLAANGPRPKAPTVRCRMCGEYGITCFEPGGVYVDTGLCPDCEGEVLALAEVVHEVRPALAPAAEPETP